MSKIHRVEIFDMDGTIVDSSHRYRTRVDNGVEKIDLEYWRANEYRAMEDGILPLAQHYRNCLRDPNCYTIIATARVMGDADWQFVREILGMPNHFISRPKDSAVSGAKLKIRGLAKFANLPQFQGIPWTFYEDNIDYLKKVCDRFQCRGVYIPSKQGH